MTIRLANLVRAADDPEHDPAVKGDPYKTLFVSRLSYEVKDTDLEREFGRFGPIERVRSPHFLLHNNDHHSDNSAQVRIIRDKDTGKHRGYAFIVYEREKDMKGIETKDSPFHILLPQHSRL